MESPRTAQVTDDEELEKLLEQLRHAERAAANYKTKAKVLGGRALGRKKRKGQ